MNDTSSLAGRQQAVSAVLLLLVAITFGQGASGKEPEAVAVKTVSAVDIQKGKTVIIGSLGVPLGTLVTVQGRWVKVERAKPSGPIFFVDRINDKPVSPPVEFSALEPLLHEIERITPIVGKRMELRGVESGTFGRITQEVMKEAYGDGQIAALPPSGFQISFYYLKSRPILSDSKK